MLALKKKKQKTKNTSAVVTGLDAMPLSTRAKETSSTGTMLPQNGHNNMTVPTEGHVAGTHLTDDWQDWGSMLIQLFGVCRFVCQHGLLPPFHTGPNEPTNPGQQQQQWGQSYFAPSWCKQGQLQKNAFKEQRWHKSLSPPACARLN